MEIERTVGHTHGDRETLAVCEECARRGKLEPAGELAREGVQAICRHDPRFPSGLRTATRANVLRVLGGLDRLWRLLEEPTVAILGARASTDYGVEVARTLGRGLAASGVTVICGLDHGVPAAAHGGALAVEGPTLTVMPGGLGVCHPAGQSALYREIKEAGCAVSLLPHRYGALPRCFPLRAATVTALARVTILVESEEPSCTLAAARDALHAGQAVAAIPGRLDSPAARGPHALLREGATLVRGVEDVLDLVYGLGLHPCPRPAPGHGLAEGPPTDASPPVEPRLREILEQVARGRDTLAKLLATGAPASEVQSVLAELELAGLIRRGHSGRYVPCGLPASQPAPAGSIVTPPARL
jgi:DNA processing protein